MKWIYNRHFRRWESEAGQVWVYHGEWRGCTWGKSITPWGESNRGEGTCTKEAETKEECQKAVEQLVADGYGLGGVITRKKIAIQVMDNEDGDW